MQGVSEILDLELKSNVTCQEIPGIKSFHMRRHNNLRWTYSATVIDESSEISVFCCIDDRLPVDSEQVTAADPNCFVSLLTDVGDRLPNHLADVLDHHLALLDRFESEQPPVMNSTSGKFELLLTKLQRKHFPIKIDLYYWNLNRNVVEQEWTNQPYISSP